MELSSFLSQHDILTQIIFDGTLRRFKFSDSKSRTGWYIAFQESDSQIIMAGDWRTREEWMWSSNGASAASPEIQKKINIAKEKAKSDKKIKQASAKEKAQRTVESMTPVVCEENEYLKRKQIANADGCGMFNGDLIIPIKNIYGAVVSTQTIRQNGDKRFLSGGEIKGGSFTFQGSMETIYLCEGFATGASIHAATGSMVVCAFYASNLEEVFNAVYFKHEKNKIILAADNDAFTVVKGKPKNTGEDYAKILKEKYDLEYILPTFKNNDSKPTDFNDLYCMEGAEAIVAQMSRDSKIEVNQQFNIIGNDALEALASPPKPELVRKWAQIGIPLTKQNQPILNELNVLKVFAYDEQLSVELYYDTFHRKIFIKGKPLEDFNVLQILTRLQGAYGLTKTTLSMVRNAVEQHAHANSRNECLDFIEGLKWDGYGRVSDFFQTYCATPDSEYTSAISKNWWISIVARILSPGIKVDNMVILEGIQGARKSSLLETIGGKWYAENTAEIGDKDFYQNLEGVLIMEIAELDSFSKAGVTTIKRTLSSRVDKYRPSYGRYSMSFPRQCVFIGTTNEREYLKDDTGGRRFWPIKCVKIDLESVKKDRDQLFAEAVYMYRDGHKWYEVPKMAAEIQENRRDADPWEDKVLQFAIETDQPLTTTSVLAELKMEPSRMSKKEANRVGKILRSHGYKAKKESVVGYKERIRIWVSASKS